MLLTFVHKLLSFNYLHKNSHLQIKNVFVFLLK